MDRHAHSDFLSSTAQFSPTSKTNNERFHHYDHEPHKSPSPLAVQYENHLEFKSQTASDCIVDLTDCDSPAKHNGDRSSLNSIQPKTTQIAQLPEAVSHTIRSGYVIPSYVEAIRQCIYNALDANANTIKITILPTAMGFIVSDNGDGIPAQDLRWIGQRGYTSKVTPNGMSNDNGHPLGPGWGHQPKNTSSFHAGISPVDGGGDESGVSPNHVETGSMYVARPTYGIRGEFLSSLISMAHVTIVTSPSSDSGGGDEATYELSNCEGSPTISMTSISRPAAFPQFQSGTTITVQNLFYNIPVRRRMSQRNASPSKMTMLWDSTQSIATETASKTTSDLSRCRISLQQQHDIRTMVDRLTLVHPHVVFVLATPRELHRRHRVQCPVLTTLGQLSTQREWTSHHRDAQRTTTPLNPHQAARAPSTLPFSRFRLPCIMCATSLYASVYPHTTSTGLIPFFSNRIMGHFYIYGIQVVQQSSLSYRQLGFPGDTIPRYEQPEGDKRGALSLGIPDASIYRSLGGQEAPQLLLKQSFIFFNSELIKITSLPKNIPYPRQFTKQYPWVPTTFLAMFSWIMDRRLCAIVQLLSTYVLYKLSLFPTSFSSSHGRQEGHLPTQLPSSDWTIDSFMKPYRHYHDHKRLKQLQELSLSCLDEVTLSLGRGGIIERQSTNERDSSSLLRPSKAMRYAFVLYLVSTPLYSDQQTLLLNPYNTCLEALTEMFMLLVVMLTQKRNDIDNGRVETGFHGQQQAKDGGYRPPIAPMVDHSLPIASRVLLRAPDHPTNTKGTSHTTDYHKYEGNAVLAPTLGQAWTTPEPMGSPAVISLLGAADDEDSDGDIIQIGYTPGDCGQNGRMSTNNSELIEDIQWDVSDGDDSTTSDLDFSEIHDATPTCTTTSPTRASLCVPNTSGEKTPPPGSSRLFSANFALNMDDLVASSSTSAPTNIQDGHTTSQLSSSVDVNRRTTPGNLETIHQVESTTTNPYLLKGDIHQRQVPVKLPVKQDEPAMRQDSPPNTSNHKHYTTPRTYLDYKYRTHVDLTPVKHSHDFKTNSRVGVGSTTLSEINVNSISHAVPGPSSVDLSDVVLSATPHHINLPRHITLDSHVRSTPQLSSKKQMVPPRRDAPPHSIGHATSHLHTSMTSLEPHSHVPLIAGDSSCPLPNVTTIVTTPTAANPLDGISSRNQESRTAVHWDDQQQTIPSSASRTHAPSIYHRKKLNTSTRSIHLSLSGMINRELCGQSANITPGDLQTRPTPVSSSIISKAITPHQRNGMTASPVISHHLIRSLHVLLQFDSKFLLALGATAAANRPCEHSQQLVYVLIDQHAADERIRLERLEQIYHASYLSVLQQTDNPLFSGVPRHEGTNETLQRPMSRSSRSVAPSGHATWLIGSHLHHQPDSPGRTQLSNSVPVADTFTWKPLKTHHKIELTSEQYLVFQHYARHIQQIGFHTLCEPNDDVGGESSLNPPQVVLIAAPVLLEVHLSHAHFTDYLGELLQVYPRPLHKHYQSSLPRFIQSILCVMACRGAIKFNDRLCADAQMQLLKGLQSNHNPFICAHGRPTMVVLFTRLFPGHSHVHSQSHATIQSNHSHFHQLFRGILLENRQFHRHWHHSPTTMVKCMCVGCLTLQNMCNSSKPTSTTTSEGIASVNETIDTSLSNELLEIPSKYRTVPPLSLSKKKQYRHRCDCEEHPLHSHKEVLANLSPFELSIQTQNNFHTGIAKTAVLHTAQEDSLLISGPTGAWQQASSVNTLADQVSSSFLLHILSEPSFLTECLEYME